MRYGAKSNKSVNRFYYVREEGNFINHTILTEDKLKPVGCLFCIPKTTIHVFKYHTFCAIVSLRNTKGVKLFSESFANV